MYNSIRKLFWILEIIIIAPIIFWKALSYKDKDIFLLLLLIRLSLFIFIHKILNILKDQTYSNVSMTTKITFMKGLLVGLILLYSGIEYKDNILIVIGMSMIIIKILNITGFTYIT